MQPIVIPNSLFEQMVTETANYQPRDFDANLLRYEKVLVTNTHQRRKERRAVQIEAGPECAGKCGVECGVKSWRGRLEVTPEPAATISGTTGLLLMIGSALSLLAVILYFWIR